MRTGMGTYANGIRISGCSTDGISVRVRSLRDAREREREREFFVVVAGSELARERQREEENR
jgi:hypothetical protein